MTNREAETAVGVPTLDDLETFWRAFEPDTLAGERPLPLIDDAIKDATALLNPDISDGARQVLEARQSRTLRATAVMMVRHLLGGGRELEERYFNRLLELVSDRAREEATVANILPNSAAQSASGKLTRRGRPPGTGVYGLADEAQEAVVTVMVGMLASKYQYKALTQDNVASYLASQDRPHQVLGRADVGALSRIATRQGGSWNALRRRAQQLNRPTPTAGI